MKKLKLIFIVICIALCSLPLVVMPIRPTTVSTENRVLSKFPSVTTRDGGVNLSFFSEFEKYFSEHFAFRNELVYADAKIQKDIFQVSSMDSVVAGSDGWLYYTSTLDDYLGTRLMTERDIYNVVHNLKIAQEYVEGRGSDFLFTVPPNKNTLYGENMPYYASYKVKARHNLDLLAPEFEAAGIPYANLFEAFRNEDEVLYLKRDSHWNNKGAVLAYNVMMDALEYSHDKYDKVDITRTIDEDGDLNRMLYTLYGKKEANYRYNVDWSYKYSDSFKSVEDPWIETKGGKGSKTLLMSRDSFGNTLIPFVAEQFKEAYFTKANPYGLERFMDEYKPDTVIMEKVERNIWDIITAPPIISSPEVEIGEMDSVEWPVGEEKLGEEGLKISSLEFDFNYYKISGGISKDAIETQSNIIVWVEGKPYKAYHTGENSFEMYIKKENLASFPVEVAVGLEKDGNLIGIAKKDFNEGDIKE